MSTRALTALFVLALLVFMALTPKHKDPPPTPKKDPTATQYKKALKEISDDYSPLLVDATGALYVTLTTAGENSHIDPGVQALGMRTESTENEITQPAWKDKNQ